MFLQTQLQVQQSRHHQVTHDGTTALHLAAHFGHQASAQLLLSSRCQGDAQRHDGVTALQLSAESGQLEMVKILLGAKLKDQQSNKAIRWWWFLLVICCEDLLCQNNWEMFFLYLGKYDLSKAIFFIVWCSS